MVITITSVVNHGEFLQTFATVTEGKVTKEVSFCHKSLPFTKDGVFNALTCKFSEPVVKEPLPVKEPILEPVEVQPYVPDAGRIADVALLEATFVKAPKVIEYASAEIEAVEVKKI